MFRVFFEMRPRGGVVTQRSAKPFTPVQFWSWPPSIKSDGCSPFDGLGGFTKAGHAASWSGCPAAFEKQNAPAGAEAFDQFFDPVNQQEACQPSGNGMSGQACSLSLAEWSGRSANFGVKTRISSWGRGAIAVLTTSSNRSNSASLIALSVV